MKMISVNRILFLIEYMDRISMVASSGSSCAPRTSSVYLWFLIIITLALSTLSDVFWSLPTSTASIHPQEDEFHFHISKFHFCAQTFSIAWSCTLSTSGIAFAIPTPAIVSNCTGAVVPGERMLIIDSTYVTLTIERASARSPRHLGPSALCLDSFLPVFPAAARRTPWPTWAPDW